MGESEIDENILTAFVGDRVPVLTIGGTKDNLEGAAKGSELGLKSLEILGFGVEGEAYKRSKKYCEKCDRETL